MNRRCLDDGAALDERELGGAAADVDVEKRDGGIVRGLG